MIEYYCGSHFLDKQPFALVPLNIFTEQNHRHRPLTAVPDSCIAIVMAFQLRNFQVVLVILSIVFAMILAQSQRCIDDIDLDDVQSYTYQIPNSDQKENPHYWDHQQLNYYVFGKFADSTSSDDTTITAGIYNGDKLIYKTEIDCRKGTWSNKILNRKSEVEEILRGKLDRNLTSCKAGEPFDLILKVNNFNAISWIFNAQPLQHEVRIFERCTTNRVAVVDDILIPQTKRISQNKMEKKQCKGGIKRPLVKLSSKFNAYQATKFVTKARGGAKFDRLVFGQCNAWPVRMENKCQEVRNWVIARSKANLTKETIANHLFRFPLDVNVTNGLGVFGNNHIELSPRCLSSKYFHFQQIAVHPDKDLSLMLGSLRSYCCCTNMRTGQVFDNNPEKYCHLSGECVWSGIACEQAVDPTLLLEIEEENKRRQNEGALKGLSKEMAKHVSSDSMIASVLRVNNTNTRTGVLSRVAG